MTFAGLEPERLRLDWVSASEGERFARIVNEFTEAVRMLGPCQWRQNGNSRQQLNHQDSLESIPFSKLGG
jgi:F420-non-reducing hydrogenase iron-sulfur subunit